jgi:hypothetical protein
MMSGMSFKNTQNALMKVKTMKINLPVTQHEVMLLAGQNIVSKTDLKGQITYVNEVFS